MRYGLVFCVELPLSALLPRLPPHRWLRQKFGDNVLVFNLNCAQTVSSLVLICRMLLTFSIVRLYNTKPTCAIVLFIVIHSTHTRFGLFFIYILLALFLVMLAHQQ